MDFGLDECFSVECAWCGRTITKYDTAFDGRFLCKQKDTECWKIGTKMNRCVDWRRKPAQRQEESVGKPVEAGRIEMSPVSWHSEGEPLDRPSGV